MDKTTGVDYEKREMNPEAIRSDLEETRAHLGETVEEIKERFSPEHMTSHAREATLGRARSVMQTTAQRARDLGSSAVESVKRDPLPYVSIGAGLGIGIGGLVWLLSRKHENGYSEEGYSGLEFQHAGEEHGYGEGMEEEGGTVRELARKTQEKARRAREQAATAFEKAKEKTGELKERAFEKSRELKSHMDDSLEKNPFVLGSLFFALGAAIGFIFPNMARPLVEKVGSLEVGETHGGKEEEMESGSARTGMQGGESSPEMQREVPGEV